jgi:serine/threonine protein kinase
MKKMIYDFEREGVGRDPLRDVCTMAYIRPLRHNNIVQIRDILMGPDPKEGLHVVMELCGYDLEQLVRYNPVPFTTSQIKGLVWQLFSGMGALHDRWLMHRDVKPANCLMTANGILKLCDFGLVRKYGEPHRAYSAEVVTPRYRAPEIFLGKLAYGPEIDVWANGCIMAELHERKQTFPGESPNDQLRKIFETLGMPTEERWSGFNKLPLVQKGLKIKAGMIDRLRKRFPAEGIGMHHPDGSNQSPGTLPPWKVSGLSEEGFKVLSACLAYDPKKRPTCAQVLNHPWFKEAPTATYIGPKRLEAAKRAFVAGNAQIRKQHELEAERRAEEKRKRALELEAQQKMALEKKEKEESDKKVLYSY